MQDGRAGEGGRRQQQLPRGTEHVAAEAHAGHHDEGQGGGQDGHREQLRKPRLPVEQAVDGGEGDGEHQGGQHQRGQRDDGAGQAGEAVAVGHGQGGHGPAGDDSAQAVQAQELLPPNRPAPGDQLLLQDGQDAEPAAEGEPGLEEDPEQRPPADRLRRPVGAGGRLVVGGPAVAVGGLAITVGGHGQGSVAGRGCRRRRRGRMRRRRAACGVGRRTAASCRGAAVPAGGSGACRGWRSRQSRGDEDLERRNGLPIHSSSLHTPTARPQAPWRHCGPWKLGSCVASVPMSVHQPSPDWTLAVWLESTLDLSCIDSTQAHCVDAEHQPCKQEVGGSSPPASSPKPQVSGDVERSLPDRFIARRWASSRRPTRGGIVEGGRFNRPVAVLGVLVAHQARHRPSVPALTAGGPTSTPIAGSWQMPSGPRWSLVAHGACCPPAPSSPRACIRRICA